MIVAGFDFGTRAAKAVVMKDGTIVSSKISEARAEPEAVVGAVMQEALSEAGLSSSDIGFAVSTGWGRRRVPFANLEMGDLPCLARGAQWLLPSVRTVIDVGGQNSRALSVNQAGKVLEYNLNDKCAAGTGRFFELVAEALEVELEQLASVASRSTNPAKISSQCCVFAESEVVTLMNEGRDLVDIVAGVHESTVRRLGSIAQGININRDVVMTGGCAKNGRLFDSLANLLKVQIMPLPVDPQIVGAIGAALIAQEKLAQT